MIKKAVWIIFIGIGFYFDIEQAAAQGTSFKNDSTTLAASNKYRNTSFFKRVFMGKNYRTAWSTPVTLPVFHLKEMGFTIKELGGGQQTKSLRLLDKEGREWALRTIDKDVEKALPPMLQNTLAERVTQDMVSAAHPYAPLTITGLAKATGVIVAEPFFFAVPDDPAFGEYRSLFANTVCMLEDRNPTPDKTETENTENVVEDLLEKQTMLIDEEGVLRARLLDMLIADWDRHQDQWRWGKKETGGKNFYYAIPRDRDQAYFQSNGLLVKIAQLISLRHLVGFTHTTHRIKQLNAKSWNFDRTFLNELNGADWQRIIAKFQTDLKDDIIKEAVSQLPPEVYPVNGATISQKLIARRNSLSVDAMRYYRFLSRYVTVLGSDEAERFHITGNKDSLTVSVYPVKEQQSKAIYQRTFYPEETHKIYLIGLAGDDKVIVDETVSTRIKLEVDGGKGEDVIDIKGKLKHKIYNSNADAKAYAKHVKNLLRIKEEQ
jgi:hypothetical protein